VAERKGRLAKVGTTQKPQTDLEAELARVKRELAADLLRTPTGAPTPVGLVAMLSSLPSPK